MRHLKRQPFDRNRPLPAQWQGMPLLGQRGSVAMLVAMSATMVLLAIGLGVEATGWTVSQTKLQRAADAAALAAAEAYAAGAGVQMAATQGAYVAEINNGVGVSSNAATSLTCTPGTVRTWCAATSMLSDNLITIQKTTGVRHATDVAFVATITTTVPFFFSALVLTGTGRTLSATATAELLASQTGKYCVLALDPNADTAISVNNGATVNATQCGVDTNSTSSSSIAMTGGATLNAANVGTTSTTAPCGMSGTGTFSCGNGAYMTVSKSSSTGQSAVANPYANVAIPAPSGTCISGSPFYNTTIYPGTYCNGLAVSYGTVTMSPGVYIINGGNFAPAGGSTVNASGVTIVLTSNSGASNIGTAQIANGTTINLTAPTTGTTIGLAIIQDPRAGTATTNLAGGTTVNIVGALDFPSSVVDFSNGSSNGANCTQLIAYQVVFTGGAEFSNSCTGSGTSAIGPSTTVSLVN
jgi:hypothetical protein